jgi:hypothetical protein
VVGVDVVGQQWLTDLSRKSLPQQALSTVPADMNAYTGDEVWHKQAKKKTHTHGPHQLKFGVVCPILGRCTEALQDLAKRASRWKQRSRSASRMPVTRLLRSRVCAIISAKYTGDPSPLDIEQMQRCEHTFQQCAINTQRRHHTSINKMAYVPNEIKGYQMRVSKMKVVHGARGCVGCLNKR